MKNIITKTEKPEAGVDDTDGFIVKRKGEEEMKKGIVLLLTVSMILGLTACGNTDNASKENVEHVENMENTENTQAVAEPQTEAESLAGELNLVCDGTAGYKLEAEERDAGFDGNYVFAQYFEGGTQEAMIEGIKSLIAAGAVKINGFVLPSGLADMEASEDGSYSFVTNGSNAFTLNEGASDEEVVAAGLEAVKSDVKSAGTNVAFELDENGYATSMSLFITRGALIDEIVDNGDGTSTLMAQGEAYAVPLNASGGMMGDAGESVVVAFPNDNISEDAEAGNIVVCYQDPEGWHLKAADRMDGYLTGGADHEDYIFEDTEGNVHYFEDADMYQRAFATQNRPGGFVNTQNNFELTEGEFLVTAWFVPGTAETDKPMLIGFTTGDSARPRLEAAIAYAQAIADNTVVASSREEAGEDANWVEDEATLDALNAAIAEAQAVYGDETLTGSSIDGAVYDLHLAIWGSLSDISAVYMGTAVEGFFDIANPDQEKAAPVELK